MWECVVFLCFFDFSPRTAKPGAVGCVREGEKLKEMPRDLQRNSVWGKCCVLEMWLPGGPSPLQ